MESGPKAVQKKDEPVRFGILSTAMINPAGLIHPAETHSGVVIKAIASRDLKNAEKAAKSYNIEKAYGSYEDLLNAEDIDAVYISLPNGMHAGKSQPPAAVRPSVPYPNCIQNGLRKQSPPESTSSLRSPSPQTATRPSTSSTPPSDTTELCSRPSTGASTPPRT